MSLKIRNMPLKELLHLHQDGELDLAPDYQRRETWSDSKKMVLIDSIARRVPINAITLYKTSNQGVTVYEVIDGKQRLTSILQFRNDQLTPLRDALKGLSEEEEAEGEELAEKVLDKKWSQLEKGTQSSFLDYEIPIYVVEGSRASAVRAFRRMNADPYALVPQEIRNAVFKDSEFLKATRVLADEIDKMSTDSDHFLVEWGLLTAPKWTRMQDLQFLSELLCLHLAGPQEARRSLDDYYTNYSKPKGPSKTKLDQAVSSTVKAIRAAFDILGNSLKPHNFDNENDLYCLIGALFTRGIPSGPQLKDENLKADLRQTLSEFRNQVLLCQDAIKSNRDVELASYAKEVKDYAGSLLAGQVNSAKRRHTRIDILVNLINERVSPIDAKSPSDLQRRLIWAKSADKKCIRCGKVVKWEDYDCGHIEAKAFGGRAVLSNLRVEHIACNRGAKEKASP